MKVYISTDIEGVCGITHWDETKLNHPDYRFFQQQLVKEVTAACDGAKQAGATHITVKDGHETGRNLIPSMLPKYVTLKRGWTGHPYSMVEGIEEGYDALVMVGCHTGAGTGKSPLSHTLSVRTFAEIKINGKVASEMLIFALVASSVNVPLVLVSGETGLDEDIKWLNPNITHIGTNSYIGDGVTAPHPETIVELIKEKTIVALSKDHISNCKINLPSTYNVEVQFKRHQQAYKGSFYPGVERTSECGVQYTSKDCFDAVRTLMWMYSVGFQP